MLFSYINTKLRDCYDSLDNLCDDMDIDVEQLKTTLEKAGFEYLPEINQFR